MKMVACAFTMWMAAAGALHAQRPAAVPVEPVAAIVEAFRTHAIVGLGNVEFRGNEQSHAFQLALIGDARFRAVVNDLVVEFGSAEYQDTIDRFVRGEEVAYESLRRVWRETTQIEYEWDLPIYEDFFRKVREVNAGLPRENQLRVLLGDPPMNWAQVHTAADLRAAMGDRDGHAVEVLRREVLAKRRRALVIYGGGHLIRRNGMGGGIVDRLEKNKEASVFTVLPETRRDLSALQADAASWPIPSLALLRGSALGAAVIGPAHAEDQVDAILYLGPPSAMTRSKIAPAFCADRAYMEMRLGRLSLVAPPPGAPINPADQLRQDCAAMK